MSISRKDLNIIKKDLGAFNPYPVDEFLPPQPFLHAPGINEEPFLVRNARRVNNKLNKLGRLKPALKRIYSLSPKPSPRSPKQLVSQFNFKQHKTVDVSIVIPVYNKFELTFQCLESLHRNVSSSVRYEVIVVDNDSSDHTHHLASLTGLNYIRNDDNRGFVEGCNIGAEKARGTYIVFLNNDAIVTPHWLESLYDTIQSSESIGLVGSKILYPDGRLQEAGGVIFQDGTGNNYGKNDHPDRYQYNYVRDVDYCSGASIIIASKLFRSFGGFDMLYAPAYYEDTDLAFKVRQAGLRVVYQPLSVIYHIEGATAGTSTSSGFKKYQAINHEKFMERWSKTLKKDHYVTDDLYIARDRSNKKHALIVDEHIPTPDKDSGSVRMIRLMEALQEEGYTVTFFPNYTKKIDGYTEYLQQKGIEVAYGPVKFHEFIEQYGKYYDMVILSRPRIGSYYLDLCQAFCEKAKIIYDTVDLHYLRLARQAEFEDDGLKKYYLDMAEKHEVLEKHLMKEADYTFVVSEAEAKMLASEGVKNVTVVSNIHEINESAYKSGFSQRKDILFVGGFAHLPNVDAIKWFVDDIFPSISRDLPDVKLHIVGSHLPDDLRAYLTDRKGIVVHGFVQDLDPLLTSSRLFIAPLRYGAGVKGKIGQAIEYGIPVVSTTIGAEGMYMTDGDSAAVADTAEAFAKKTVELYTDSKLWQRLQKNAKNIISEHFSKDAVKKSIEQIV
jgi:O-antigen biosynthesis protein